MFSWTNFFLDLDYFGTQMFFGTQIFLYAKFFMGFPIAQQIALIKEHWQTYIIHKYSWMEGRGGLHLYKEENWYMANFVKLQPDLEPSLNKLELVGFGVDFVFQCHNKKKNNYLT